MHIIPAVFKTGKGIYTKAKPVDASNWAEAKAIGKEMVEWLDGMQGRFLGKFQNAWAISHGQVAEAPLSIFVLSDEFIGKPDGKTNKANFFWPSRIIFNPELLEAPPRFEVDAQKEKKVLLPDGTARVELTTVKEERSNLYQPSIKEACMSFPGRDGKYMKRFYRIKVGYDVIGFFGQRKHVEEWIEGVRAHIFQHELEHAVAVDMYHK
jgi:hypothetical protein